MPILLEVMFSGEAQFISSRKIAFARTALTHSIELPTILAYIYRPPRTHSKGVRSTGGGETMKRFAQDLQVCFLLRLLLY